MGVRVVNINDYLKVADKIDDYVRVKTNTDDYLKVTNKVDDYIKVKINTDDFMKSILRVV